MFGAFHGGDRCSWRCPGRRLWRTKPRAKFEFSLPEDPREASYWTVTLTVVVVERVVEVPVTEIT
jgi:hypothetical protein